MSFAGGLERSIADGHAAVSAHDVRCAPRDGSVAPSPRGAARAHILLVDEDADARDYLQQLLGERFEVQAVADGAAGLEAARQHPPDLILAEVMVPRLDGLALLCAVRAAARTQCIPLVLLSARDGEEFRVEALQSGADDYIVKPCSAHELLARVAARVELARVRRATADHELARYRERLEELVAERTEALKASLEQLRRSERLASLGTLAAGIAHEINNPLNAILLTAQYALQVGGDMAEALETISAQARRGGNIVKGILKFAREEQTTKFIDDLNDAVRRAAELAGAYLHPRRFSLELDLAESLPPILMNASEIEQVLIHLIKNAADARDGSNTRDGGTVHVTLRTAAEDGAVRLIVEDDGPGIPPDYLRHVFDPFFTTRPPRGGTGLGLSICHGIITEHGGTIDVESRVGCGTRFVVQLPAARGADGAEVMANGPAADC